MSTQQSFHKLELSAIDLFRAQHRRDTEEMRRIVEAAEQAGQIHALMARVLDFATQMAEQVSADRGRSVEADLDRYELTVLTAEAQGGAR